MSSLYEKIIKLPIASIKWLDTTDRTLKESEFVGKKIKDLLTERVTVGYLYKSNKDGVILVRDVCEDGDVETCTIPHRMIIGGLDGL